MSSLHSKDSVFKLESLDIEELKRIIAIQQRELKGKDKRLKGVVNLTRICSESEEKLQSWRTRANNYQTALRRAEARIAILNKKLGIGPQTAFEIDVVNPGVSQKDYDAITIENIKLKEALEHIVPMQQGGIDIVLKNQELYEMVTKLQEEITAYNDHIRELEIALAGNDNELALKVNDQAKKMMKLERCMNAKQVFSEKLMKENKDLLNRLEKTKNQEFMKEQDVPDGQASEKNMNEQFRNEERERMSTMIIEKEKQMEQLVAEINNKSKLVQDLTNELGTANKIKNKIESELSESVKKCSDFQAKCNSFFQNVIRLNRKLQDSEEEISELKQAIENFHEQYAEKEAMMVMMRDSFEMNEEDFKKVTEEKERTQEQLNESNQECERLRRENQSHMATIRVLHRENEEKDEILCSLRQKVSQLQDYRNNNLRAIVEGRTSPNDGLVQSGQESEQIRDENESEMANLDLNIRERVGYGSNYRQQANQANDLPTLSPTLVECRNFIDAVFCQCGNKYILKSQKNVDKLKILILTRTGSFGAIIGYFEDNSQLGSRNMALLEVDTIKENY